MKMSWEEYKQHENDTRPGAWPRLEYENMQTGRTTRMVQEARRLSQAGERVLVVAHTAKYATLLRDSMCPVPDKTAYGFRLRDMPNVIVRGYETLDMNPHTLRVYGGFEDFTVLWDASVFEHHFATMLVELHRFDGELPKELK